MNMRLRLNSLLLLVLLTAGSTSLLGQAILTFSAVVTTGSAGYTTGETYTFSIVLDGAYAGTPQGDTFTATSSQWETGEDSSPFV